MPLPNMDVYYRNRRAENRASMADLTVLVLAVIVLALAVGFWIFQRLQ